MHIIEAPSPTNRRRIKPTTVDQSYDDDGHAGGGGGGRRGHRRSASPPPARRLEPKGSPGESFSPAKGKQRREGDGTGDDGTDWTIPEHTARQKKPTRAQAAHAIGGSTNTQPQRSPRAVRAPKPARYRVRSSLPLSFFLGVRFGPGFRLDPFLRFTVNRALCV